MYTFTHDQGFVSSHLLMFLAWLIFCIVDDLMSRARFHLLFNLSCAAYYF